MFPNDSMRSAHVRWHLSFIRLWRCRMLMHLLRLQRESMRERKRRARGERERLNMLREMKLSDEIRTNEYAYMLCKSAFFPCKRKTCICFCFTLQIVGVCMRERTSLYFFRYVPAVLICRNLTKIWVISCFANLKILLCEIEQLLCFSLSLPIWEFTGRAPNKSDPC